MDIKLFDLEAYIANHLKDIDEKCPQTQQVFGADFKSFFYKGDIDKIIKEDVLPLLGFPEKERSFLDNDHWKSRHPFNFPGPFYTGESDTCGTGHPEAGGRP